MKFIDLPLTKGRKAKYASSNTKKKKVVSWEPEAEGDYCQ
jgi:hypothetical protein